MIDPAFLGNSVPDEKQMRDAVRTEYELYKQRKGIYGSGGSSTTTYGDYNPMLREAIEAQRAGLQGERSNLLKQQAVLNMSPEERDRLRADQLLQSVLGSTEQVKPSKKPSIDKTMTKKALDQTTKSVVPQKQSTIPVPEKKQKETKKTDTWLDKVPKVTNALGEQVSSGKSPRDIIKENKQLFNEIKRYDNSLSDKEAYKRLLSLLDYKI